MAAGINVLAVDINDLLRMAEFGGKAAIRGLDSILPKLQK